ncbi:MAG: NAD(P)H-quinone oxidoreductase [Thermoanaerobaculia bacterium]
MRAILPWNPERSGAIVVGDVPLPTPGAGEVLIRVVSAGLNRADLLQMRGLYPPPPGASEIPGLECAGIIEALGSEVKELAVGQRVMALLAGGGHGEAVAVPAGQVMPVPESLSLEDAGAIPEAALTSWTNLVVEGGLRSGETLVVTGATSGIGSFAVQVARELGATVIAAGRSVERLERLRDLGVGHLVALDAGMPAAVKALTDGKGADLVLDLVAGEWLTPSLDSLAYRGRLVLVGVTAAARAEVDLGLILRRRLHVIGSVLRARPIEEKSELVRGFSEFGLTRLADGRLRAVVDRRFPFAEAAAAYACLERERPLGKVLLET